MARKKWIDEAGNEIPEHRITPAEKLSEKYSAQLRDAAKKINALLIAVKYDVQAKSMEVFDAIMEENNVNIEKHKGNFTWFSFDRSVKIEVSVSEKVVFDDALITACQKKLMEFLNKSLSSSLKFIRDLVLDAFNTRAGKLDTKKIMYLLRYEDKINDPLYSEAMDLLQKSIRRPDKKTYFRIWQRNANGEYQLIDLNFSSI